MELEYDFASSNEVMDPDNNHQWQLTLKHETSPDVMSLDENNTTTYQVFLQKNRTWTWSNI